MLQYDLRLYSNRDLGAPSPRERQYDFEAADDLAAIERAMTLYAGELAACRFALLSSVGGRVVWLKRETA